MDLGNLPDLISQFSNVATGVYAHVYDLLPRSQLCRNIWTALTEPGALPTDQKLFHLFKFAAGAGALAVSIETFNVSGIVASAIAEGEVVYDLSNAGARHLEVKKIPTPT
jgi:hypothetical protein